MAPLSMHFSISNNLISLLLFACENTSNWDYSLCQRQLLPWFSPFARKPPPDRSTSVLSSTCFQPTQQADAQRQHLHEDVSSGIHHSDSKLPLFSKTHPGSSCVSAPDLRSLFSSSLLPTSHASPEYLPPAVVRKSRYKITPLPLMNSLSHVTNSHS